jgi:2-dehydropantoate 2-reductase
MLNDMRRGIWKTEIQEIDGSVSRAGKKVGLETPFIDKIIELVTRAQDTQTIPTMDNVDEFDGLLEKYAFK